MQYQNGEEQEYLVDPLLDKRYTQTDGDLTIHAPNPALDRGEFRCSASNRYGTTRSKKVSIRYACKYNSSDGIYSSRKKTQIDKLTENFSAVMEIY